MKKFYISEMDVGSPDGPGIRQGEPYSSRAEAEKELAAVESNPLCEVGGFYIEEVEEKGSLSEIPPVGERFGLD